MMNMSQGHDMSMSNNNTTSNMDIMKMHMSFYWGKNAIVLFSGWPKHSVGMYILAILFVFIIAMLAEVLSSQHMIIRRGTRPIMGTLTQSTFFYFIRISFHYLVMLAVMSFNVGIFIAAVAGHTLGFFINKTRALAGANGEQQHGSSVVPKSNAICTTGDMTEEML